MGVSDEELLRQEEDRTRRGKEDRERWSDRAINEKPVLGRKGWLRLAWVAGLSVLLVLLGTLPPLLNVSRYQRRVASAIADSIGRPVHFDSITMHVLPLPGFTIQNFVVMEDPAFGAEPAMRANVVEARVRVSSLWRRRVEISRIRLEAPSVNLVRRPDGSWNLQGVVTQAGYLQSAPTTAPQASEVPRFPYVEATAARVNLKLGDDKLPYSLVDAKFALWLPNAQEWHLRLQGRPLRTDTDVSDVGQLSVEATLGRGVLSEGGGAAHEPLTLDASWQPTPMGEAGKLVMGRDGGWRGEASAELSLHGTPAAMVVVSDVHLHNLRRADFVPRQPMSVDAHCEAEAGGVLYQLHHVRCLMPTTQSTSLLDAVNIFRSRAGSAVGAPDVLSLQAEMPNALDWRSATASLELQKGSPEWLLGWMRLFSTRIAPDLRVDGDLSAAMSYAPGQSGDWNGTVLCHCVLPTISARAEAGTGPHAEAPVSPKSSVSPRSSNPDANTKGEPQSMGGAWLIRLSHKPAGTQGTADVTAVNGVVETPPASTGTGDPAIPAMVAKKRDVSAGVQGEVSRSGYTLQYESAAVARYAAGLVPTLGDEMPLDASGPVQSKRRWGGVQVWTGAAPALARTVRRAPRRRAR